MGMLGIGPFATPHGGFAPSIAVDARRLYPIHPKLSDPEAGLLEPATVAVHAVRRTPIRLGDSVVVLGAGADRTACVAVRESRRRRMRCGDRTRS